MTDSYNQTNINLQATGGGGGGGGVTFTAIIAANFTAATTNIVRFDPSGGTFQIDAPPAPSTNDEFGVKNVTTDLTTITVSGNGFNIEGLATFTPAATTLIGGDGVVVRWGFDGTQWVIL